MTLTQQTRLPFYTSSLALAALFATALASLTGCAQHSANEPHIVNSQLKLVPRDDGLVGIFYQAELFTPKTPNPEPTSPYHRSRDRYGALPEQRSYSLSVPSNSDVIREHTALNHLEMLLKEQQLCPVNYSVDSLEHIYYNIQIKAHCNALKMSELPKK